MSQWIRRLRGALGMGLTWAIGWALAGLGIGVASRLLPGLPWGRIFEVFDAPLPALAIPGFIGGVLFAVVLGIAARGRRIDQLSMLRFGMWGAAGGLLVSLLPAILVVTGLATPAGSLSLWRLTLTLAVPLTVLSATSAAVSLSLARRTIEGGRLRGPDGAGRRRLGDDSA